MNSFAIPIAFVLLASLLLWVLIGARGHWWLKLSLMILTLLVGCSIKTSLSSYLGYPRPTTILEMGGQTAWLFWVVVDEPNKIAMWMKLENDPAPGALGYWSTGPKVYEFSYTRDLHTAVQSFLTQIIMGSGKPIHISFAKKGKGSPGEGNSLVEHGLGALTTDVFVLPEPKAPEKR